MNDFFYQIAGVKPCDSVYQLLTLYSCYKELYASPESLDDFIFWGGILLSDFNDVDKYLVNPETLFTNVKEFRSIQDSYEFLEPSQKEAIDNFVGHFSSGGKYKEEFLKLWNILLSLYRSFNEKLASEGYSYEGQVYRNLAERLEKDPVVDVISFKNTEKFVFVGLNALNECEKVLLRKLRNAKLAEFCWDYSSEWIKNKDNKSSFFLEKNISDFPQAFKLDTKIPLQCPEINVLSIPSSVGQAKQLPQILTSLGAKGLETAIVLPDEKLLLPVLNSIPEKIERINVTMGYPLRSSAVWTLMNDIAVAQLHLRLKGGKWHFYHKQLKAVLSNSILKSIYTEEDIAAITAINEAAQYYVSEESLCATPLLSLIFSPVVKDAKPQNILPIIEYQKGIILEVGKKLSAVEGMAMELDFAREYFLTLARMESYDLEVLPTTYFRLINSLLSRVSVPFKGEPLSGLQIMGPLETRALDFENLIILSCNEDLFPSRNTASSFIPPELRKGFGLPTYEYQDAVWAYYFYRMIQRSRKVWMLYDSRTEGLQNGEESRYIKQLSMHFKANVTRYVAKSDIRQGSENLEIEKTEEMMEEFRQTKNLSATALQTYLACGAKFYFEKVKGLRETKDLQDSLDASMMGTVFHSVMETLYSLGSHSISELKNYLKGDLIEKKVETRILEELKTIELIGKNLIYRDMISRYVRKAIERDIELLTEKGRGEIKILGLEKKLLLTINGYKFIGMIDRLDSIEPGIIRIVDYKTGSGDYDFDLDVVNEEGIAERVFGDDNSKRDKIALQLYLYEKLISHSMSGTEFEFSVYHTRRLFTEKIKSVKVPTQFVSEMDIKLSELLEELSDINSPFKRSEDENVCKYCSFKTLCGR